MMERESVAFYSRDWLPYVHGYISLRLSYVMGLLACHVRPCQPLHCVPLRCRQAQWKTGFIQEPKAIAIA